MFRLVPTRRHVFAALLLVLVLFQCAGWLVAWHIARQEARRLMRFDLESTRTGDRHIVLPTAQLARLRAGKREIRYEGNLYDIRSHVVRGDSSWLTLRHDACEQYLFEALGELLDTGRSPGTAPLSPLRAWWAKWFGAVFLLPDPRPVLVMAPADAKPLLFTYLMPTAQKMPSDWSPPPEGKWFFP